MKKIYFVPFCLCFIFFNSCTISKTLKEERKQWNFKNWDVEFKERAFCLCVLKGYENPKLEKSLWENDKTFYNPTGIAIFDKTLEPIIEKEIKKIKLDSINSLGHYPDDLKPLYQKRKVLEHCLAFYNSSELNEITKNEKRSWNKISNIMSEIHKSIPTY
ncbi:hypothetical protein ACFS5J_12305 [Flavobacterium chuncheonense]|uniref:Lipoprotein n=1 Tax=Flavobacterium chuncheonense TaxID=2026653 RepID=A0ABW5YQX8_9FLAO